MTRDQFIDAYLSNSNLGPTYRTATGFRVGERERVALPCACGDEQCHGWAMINNDHEDIALHKQLYGPQRT